LEITSFASCDECLASTKNYDLIFYHLHKSLEKYKSNNEHLLPLKKVLPIAPVIIFSDFDSYDSICAAFDFGVRGYIPTATTTPETAVEIMYLVKSGGTFVPPSGLSLRKSGLLQTRDPVTGQQFTPRETAVLELLKLGKTNKIIAYDLQISESSVKSHIRNIMNKLNATNRTEVACRAHELERGR
jgi:DNA-binding NarL/FixJ family response regulator